jgi:hypothetical protein
MDKNTMKEILGACITEDNKEAFQGVGAAIRVKWKSPRDSIGMETLARVFEELSGDVEPEEQPDEKPAKKPRAKKAEQPADET